MDFKHVNEEFFAKFREYELQEQRFKVITRIEISQFLQFYTAVGRYPSEEEVTAINTFGLELILTVISQGKYEDWKRNTRALIQDLEKVQLSKARFIDTCSRILKNFFGI
jgi:hypothetical protein